MNEIYHMEEIPGFPDYYISPSGTIFSFRLNPDGIPLRPMRNQQGILSVLLWNPDGQACRRAIAPLVVDTFIPPHQYPHYNESLIHLDGDKSNCFAENLMRRPRWFALKYHRQFYDAPEEWMYKPIVMESTGEVFDRAIDCCVKYGLLISHIMESLGNPSPTPVQPVWSTFRRP